MKKKYQIPVLIVLLFAITLLFGCGTQVDTQMTVENNLSGTRVIRCTISKQDVQSKVTGGEQALDTLLELNCPAQLNWKKSADSRSLTYIFTLDFVNRDEYVQKVEALLGRHSAIVFSAPNTPLVKGFQLKEDFSSTDLLSCLDTAAIQQGLIASDTKLWNQNGSTAVQYQGNTIQTQTQINVNQIEYLPIDKITVNTEIGQENTFQRTIAFQIPQSTYNAVQGTLGDYMKARVPAAGTGSFQSTSTGKVFTVSFSAKSAAELAQKTALALDSTGKSVFTEKRSSLLSSQLTFTEYLDFSSFASGKNGKVFVDYLYHADTIGVSGAEVFSGGKWSDVSDYITTGAFSFSNDMNSFSVRLAGRNEYPLEDISVFMVQQPDAAFTRRIVLTFQGENGAAGAQKAKSYFEKLNALDTTVTAENNVCTILLSGSTEKLNAALSTLFGSGNSIQLTNSSGFQLYDTSTVQDCINLGQFTSDTGYASGLIHYYFTAPNSITGFSQQDSDNSVQTVSAQGSEGALVFCNQSAVTTSCSALNGWFVAALSGLGVLTICLLAIPAYFVTRLLRKRKQETIILPFKPVPKFVVLEQRCPRCGSQLYKGMRFCIKCGEPIRQDSQAPNKN